MPRRSWRGKSEALLPKRQAMAMKKLLLSGVAALFLATGTTHAAAEEKTTNTWDLRTRSCTVIRLARSEHLRDDDLDMGNLLELQKFIPRLRACEKFLQCVANRDAGKIKPCYWPRIL